jgi:hypothetical protein
LLARPAHLFPFGLIMQNRPRSFARVVIRSCGAVFTSTNGTLREDVTTCAYPDTFLPTQPSPTASDVPPAGASSSSSRRLGARIRKSRRKSVRTASGVPAVMPTIAIHACGSRRRSASSSAASGGCSHTTCKPTC